MQCMPRIGSLIRLGTCLDEIQVYITITVVIKCCGSIVVNGIRTLIYVQYIYNIDALTVNIEFIWRGLETEERRAFCESFHPFRDEPHKFYIFRQYTNIIFILQ